MNDGAIYRFITKPWDDDKLRATIREAFNCSAQGQENARLSRQHDEARARLAELETQLQSQQRRTRPKVSRARTAPPSAH